MQGVGDEGAAHAVHHRKAQCQAQGRVEAEHGQRLAEIVDAAATGVERRIGHPQHACAQCHVHADDLGRGGHVHVRILRKFDDAQRNPGRRGQVAAVVQGGLEIWLHESSPTVATSIQLRSLSGACHARPSPRHKTCVTNAKAWSAPSGNGNADDICRVEAACRGTGCVRFRFAPVCGCATDRQKKAAACRGFFPSGKIRPGRPASSLRRRSLPPPSRCLRQRPGAGSRSRRRRRP